MELSDDKKAVDYWRSAALRQRPTFVPATVRLSHEVFGDGPFRGRGVPAGDHACRCNQWGAVTVLDREGKALGIRPAEFEVLSWQENIEPSTQAKEGQA